MYETKKTFRMATDGVGHTVKVYSPGDAADDLPENFRAGLEAEGFIVRKAPKNKMIEKVPEKKRGRPRKTTKASK